MAVSLDTVEVNAALIVSPSAVLILTASAPNLDPFKRIDPATDDLWVRLEANGQHAQTPLRIEFVTRRKPYTTGTTPRLIAHSDVISAYGVRAFRLLAIQMVADLMMAQEPPPADDASITLLHLIAFIEPPSYDWNRYQALCAQFDAERRARDERAANAGGAVPGRQSRRESAKRSQTRVAKVAPARERSTLGSEFDWI